jgi:hypothetical protein
MARRRFASGGRATGIILIDRDSEMNRQNWKKRGQIFVPHEDQSWFVSHAALPVVQSLRAELHRIYFSGRDEEGRAQIGYFEYDFAAPGKLMPLSDSPVIRVGALGAFDDRGATSSCIVEHEDRQYQYYTGWNVGLTVPFYLNIGLAISDDRGKTFRKASSSPVLGRTAVDPYLTASPSVLIENGLWRMWYVSGVRWVIENGQPKHHYHIKYAESDDGVEWRPTGRICIDFKSAEEYAIARPCVLREGNRYRMWYCYRGSKYRIGYAESGDGLVWERKDEQAGIEPSDSGWDSEEMAYPFVFRTGERLRMCYNGNGYGKTGIGLAVLEK